MLSYLADMESIWGPLRLFRYISFRAMGGAATSLTIGMIIAPFVIAKLKAMKARQVLRSAEEVGRLADLHNKKKDTPTMGGLIILAGIIVPTLLWADLTNFNVLMVMLVTVWLGLIGYMDDYLKAIKKEPKGMVGRKKLVGQISIGLLGI